ncbi:TPA: hypothetical protein QDB28_006410 [Burkholderia vietnamiensis]|nr:hypothetical protein [Burkholderia vietnamiensis]
MREIQHIEADLKAAFGIQDPLIAEFNTRLKTLSSGEYDTLKARVDEARKNVQRLIKERNRTRAALRAASTPDAIQAAIDLLKRGGFTVVDGRAE